MTFLLTTIIVGDNPTNDFVIFANVLAIVLKLAIIVTNQLFLFLLLLLLKLRVSNQWLPSARSPRLMDPNFTIFTVNLQNIITNTIHMVGNASFSFSLLVLFGMPPSSWLMDFACCNHMIPNLPLFSQFEPAPHLLNIRTTNGSTMFGHNIGSILTSNLLVPNLSYNLFFMRKLAELGYRITFDYSGYTAQDLRMK